MLSKIGKTAGTVVLLIILFYGRDFAIYLSPADANIGQAVPANTQDASPKNTLATIDH